MEPGVACLRCVIIIMKFCATQPVQVLLTHYCYHNVDCRRSEIAKVLMQELVQITMCTIDTTTAHKRNMCTHVI